MPDHLDNEGGHDYPPSYRAEIFGDVHGVSFDANSRVEEDLIDQLFNSSEKRLARLLLLLAHFGKEGSPQPIKPAISQETLAEMIGTTRSRVSFFMNKFRKLGLISYNGQIEVHNSLLNAVLNDKPEIHRDKPARESSPSFNCGQRGHLRLARLFP